MKASDVSGWFDEYLDAFAACGRGERETRDLLAYYGVPLVLTTDGACITLATSEQVVAAVGGQIEGMRAAGYASTRVLEREVRVLNAKSALYAGSFSRRRGNGDEISRLAATYVITDGAAGRRICLLAVHG